MLFLCYYLETAAEAKNKVQSRILLDIVVREAAILKLLTGENETLHIRREALFILDLVLDNVDGVGRFDLERDSLAR